MRPCAFSPSLGALPLALIAVFLPSLAAAQKRPNSPPALKVTGNEIRDSRGHKVILRGVNAASLEWSSNGEGHILETIRRAIEEWHSNVVRIPLAQDRWFGKAPEQKDGGRDYRALVQQAVDACSSHGAYAILDLHWSDTGVWGKQIGQHAMPDANSVEFWRDCAAVYKDHPAVIFDLYNEPHDVSWDVWLNGGSVTEKDRSRNYSSTYDAVGLQKLLDTVRATGARNVVIAGGLDWAYDLSGMVSGKRLSDPKGHGVIYACHYYPFKGDTVEQWVVKMEAATKQFPVIVSEFGAQGNRPYRGLTGGEWVKQVVAALSSHDWHWTAWDFHPSASPCLISDWNYAPTPAFGVPVKAALVDARPPRDSAPSKSRSFDYEPPD